MVHIGETSERYVRDARELISVGETVRARIVESGGQRLALSFKHLPPPERAERPARVQRPEGAGRGERREPVGGGERGAGRGGRGGGRGRGRRDPAPGHPHPRAAHTRRGGPVVRSRNGADRGRRGPGSRGRAGATAERD